MHTALGALAINNVMRLTRMALMRPEQPSQPRRVFATNAVQLWVGGLKVFSHNFSSSAWLRWFGRL
jgi:hypothetical protein